MINEIFVQNNKDANKTLKRVSITSSVLAMNDNQKQNKINVKSKDMINNLKKLTFEIKQYNFQPFDLQEIEDNHFLITNNYKFAALLDSLKQYNERIILKRQNDIVSYKLHDFFYTTLKICSNKTEKQAEFYLRELTKQFSQHKNRKNCQVLHQNIKKQSKTDEENIVRQTYKSTLPLQIDKYERRFFHLPAHKSQNVSLIGKYLKKRNKKIKIINGLNNDSEDSDSEMSCMKKIKESPPKNRIKQQQIKNKILKIQKLKQYHLQILKMKKIKQQNEQKQLQQKLKKNQVRVQCQSSNNFYKIIKNNNDILDKTVMRWNQHYNGEKRNNNGNNSSVEVKNWDGKILMETVTDQNVIQYSKKNQNALINSTSIGFYHIKKKRLSDLKEKKKVDQTSIPQFSRNYSTEKQRPFSSIQNQKQKKNEHLQIELKNIQGFNLMKNIKEMGKNKKKKK